MSSQANAQIMKCSKCGAKNRIHPARATEAVCGRCKEPLTTEAKTIYVTDANFATEVEGSSLPVLVDFWAAWCGPCRLVAPVIEQLATELSGKVRVGKLDVDANQQTAAKFKVQSIPSLLVFNQGKEVDRMIGAQPKQAILQRLNQYL